MHRTCTEREEAKQEGHHRMKRSNSPDQRGREEQAQSKRKRKCANGELRQHKHYHKRQVRMFRLDFVEISRPHIGGKFFRAEIPRRGKRIIRFGSAWKEAVLLPTLGCDLLFIDDCDSNRFVRIRLDASGCFTDREAARAHIAFNGLPVRTNSRALLHSRPCDAARRS